MTNPFIMCYYVLYYYYHTIILSFILIFYHWAWAASPSFSWSSSYSEISSKVFLSLFDKPQFLLASSFPVLVLVHGITLCSLLIISSPFILCYSGNLISHPCTSLYLNPLVRSLRNHSFLFLILIRIICNSTISISFVRLS